MTFEETWGTANPDAIGGSGDDLDPPRDGTHDVELLTGAAAVGEKSGKAYVKLGLRVISVNDQGYEWGVLLGFKSQAQANMTKRQIRNLGVNVDEVTGLDELDAALKARCGSYYTVTVKTDGTFRNTYFEDGGPVTPDFPIPDLGVPAPVGGGTDDEDIPF